MDTHDSLGDSSTDAQDNIFDDIVSNVEHTVQNAVSSIVADFTPHVDAPHVADPGLDWPTLAPAIATPDMAPATTSVIGDPLDDMAFWHLQQSNDTCAIVSQQFVIEQLTGQSVSEDQLVQLAEQHGWYAPGSGTSPDDCGNLLQLFGLNVEHHTGATIDDIANQLESGHGVIVGVDAEKIWPPQIDPSAPLSAAPSIPAQGADHAVEVIGIDRSDPNNPMVILNDSGTPNGAGELVPLATFMSAWADGGNTMVDAW